MNFESGQKTRGKGQSVTVLWKEENLKGKRGTVNLALAGNPSSVPAPARGTEGTQRKRGGREEGGGEKGSEGGEEGRKGARREKKK